MTKEKKHKRTRKSLQFGLQNNLPRKILIMYIPKSINLKIAYEVKKIKATRITKGRVTIIARNEKNEKRAGKTSGAGDLSTLTLKLVRKVLNKPTRAR